MNLLLALFISLSLNGDKDAKMELQPTMGPKPELYVMPLVTSRYALPDGYGKAQATFEDATKLYEAGKPNQAAPLFIKVAEQVKAPKPETTYTEAFAKMRSIAYQNAAIAYTQAGDKAGLKKALTAALKNDPENAEVLNQLIAKK